jgi:hypothetical protein
LSNCTRDEGRSFEVGNQVLISSHRKLLLSKAMVVNVAEKSGQDSGRQGWDQFEFYVLGSHPVRVSVGNVRSEKFAIAFPRLAASAARMMFSIVDSTARTEELVNFWNHTHYLFRNYIAFVIYGHLDLNPVQLGSSAPNSVGVFLQRWDVPVTSPENPLPRFRFSKTVCSLKGSGWNLVQSIK